LKKDVTDTNMAAAITLNITWYNLSCQIYSKIYNI